jgi:hypothetical protein
MDNLKNLSDAKELYTEVLCDCLSKFLYMFFYDLYISNKKKSKDSLQILQEKCLDIKNFSQEKIQNIYLDFCKDYKIDWLGDLIKIIIISNTSILISLVKTNNKFEMTIPTAPRFIHLCLMELAKVIYERPFLYLDDIKPVEIISNRKEVYSCINTCILRSIRKSLQIKEAIDHVLYHSKIDDYKEIGGDLDIDSEDELLEKNEKDSDSDKSNSDSDYDSDSESEEEKKERAPVGHSESDNEEESDKESVSDKKEESDKESVSDKKEESDKESVSDKKEESDKESVSDKKEESDKESVSDKKEESDKESVSDKKEESDKESVSYKKDKKENKKDTDTDSDSDSESGKIKGGDILKYYNLESDSEKLDEEEYKEKVELKEREPELSDSDGESVDVPVGPVKRFILEGK